MSIEFTPQQLKAFRAEFCKGFNDDQFEVSMAFCQLRDLLPGKHVLFQLRRSKEWDDYIRAKVEVTKVVFITTIDAARLIALRSKEYTGQDPETYIYLDSEGNPSVESKIPLPQVPLPPAGQPALPREPWAVRTTVYRKSFDHPITSVARFDAYASTYKQDNAIRLTEMWIKRGPEQLAKCSEMLSLRKSFPEELASLYLDIELKNEEEPAPTAVTPASVVPLPPTAPPVNQQPAVPTAAPRPNEPKVEYHTDAVPATLPEHSGPTLVVKETEAAKEKALAAVPDLKPASELPPPAKRGRKPKEQPAAPAPVPGEITDADIANASLPQEPVEDQTAAAEAFVADLDPTPTKEEKDGFVARIRALTAKGAKGKEIQARILELSGVTDHNLAPVRHWKQALEEFETKPPSKELGTF